MVALLVRMSLVFWTFVGYARAAPYMGYYCSCAQGTEKRAAVEFVLFFPLEFKEGVD